MSTLFCLTLLLAAASVYAGKGYGSITANIKTDTWGYEGNVGPKHWPKLYPTCAGNKQSPININHDTCTSTDGSNPQWIDYNKLPSSMTLTNNDHSISLTGNGTTVPCIQLDDGKVFELTAVHFHWGKNNRAGSEHHLQGRIYPLEMHAVHKRMQNGVEVQPPEFIVVAVLFDISHQPHYSHPGLDRILDAVREVSTADTTTSVTPFAWGLLVEEFFDDYYMYRGSLTTPPCSEVVTFFIRNQIAKMSDIQMETMRLPRNEKGRPIAGNYRPIQPLNGREVFYVTPSNQGGR